jgi:chitodextrinase
MHRFFRSILFVLPLLSMSLALQAHAGTTNTYNATQFSVTNPIGQRNLVSLLPSWSDTQAYSNGNSVRYNPNGRDYQARWWTQGEVPGTQNAEAWKSIPDVNGIPQPWSATQIYHAGEQSVYNGKRYSAKWWTRNSQPDLATSDWTAVTEPAWSQIVITGNGSKAEYSDAFTQGWRQLSNNYSWTITQDPGNVVAYWKVIKVMFGNIYQGEIARGTGRTGTVSGTDLYLYLCTAQDFCARVDPAWVLVSSNWS